MSTNIQNLLKKHLLSHLSSWESQLLEGDLYNFELSLMKQLQLVHASLMSLLLNKVGCSQAFREQLISYGKSFGLTGLKLREVRLQTGVGIWIKYKSYYASQQSSNEEFCTRHLSHLYWGCLQKSSPVYYSLLSCLSSICPSYQLASEVLAHQGIENNPKRIRDLSVKVGAIGSRLGIDAQLDKAEDMCGLRVVVQIDGGRSRVRQCKDSRSKKGYQKYDTPWKEPKLLAIHVLDEKGQIAHSLRKPIYQASIQDASSCMKDLVATLKVLKVNKAKQVQFLADGAPFIWKRIRRAFKKAGVVAKKITYTLDYYHAVEHLKELSELLPLVKSERIKKFEEWKDYLWQGQVGRIIRKFKRLIKEKNTVLNQEMITALAYFKKHQDRMKYKRFKRDKLLCGSGLVESAIRRIINLRFKGSSAFWLEKNLNNMLVLRCAFLSKRWYNLMNAIQLEIKQTGTI